MTASSEEGLQRMMEALERIPEEYGMRINLKKTKVMMFTKGQPRKVYQSGFKTLNLNRLMNSASWEVYLLKMLVVIRRPRKELQWQLS